MKKTNKRKFELSCVDKDCHSDEEKKKFEKLGCKYKFDLVNPSTNENEYRYISGFPKYIEIGNLKELIDFVKEYGAIILDKDGITIYNDYIE